MSRIGGLRYSLEDHAICQYNLLPPAEGSNKSREERMFELVFADANNRGRHVASGEFLCGRDLYRARYEFDSEIGDGRSDRFRLNYIVKGPAKDYETVSSFVREADGE